MDLLILCLLIAMLLPYLVRIPVMKAMNEAGGYDNNNPRAQQARLTGVGARAVAAHHNSFESLIVFSAAVLCAIATNTITTAVQVLAVIHIIARIAHPICFLKDLAVPRSIAWAVGYFCALIIVILCF